ncbi:MAG: MCE family protein [Oceanicaulis sp.]|nr:MCE family protein [Oceanicaulis sp.]
METKAHHTLVGFFVVFLTLAGGFFALWLSQIAFDREYSEFDVLFDGPVRGLRVASEVRFNGIQVGEVTELGLNPEDTTQVIARIRVDATTPVKVDSTAQLEPQGLTGLSLIQISGGSSDAARLESRFGDRAPRIHARQTQLDDLISGGETLLESSQLAFARVSALLTDENIASFSRTLRNIETITGRFAEDDGLLDEVRTAARSLDQAARDVSDAAVGIEQFGRTAEIFLTDEVSPMVADVSAASIEVDRASQETYAMLSAMRPGLEQFTEEGLAQLTAALRDLRGALAAMERIMLDLEEDPTAFAARSAGEEVEVPR